MIYQNELQQWLNKRKVVKLTKIKEADELEPKYIPADKFAFDRPYEYQDVKSEEHLALIVDEDYVVIDVDDKKKTGLADKVLEIVRSYGWLCNILKTDSGYHLWFKNPQPLENYVNKIVPLGFSVDIKSWDKKSITTIKKNGKDRQWIQFYPNVDLLPKELTPFLDKRAQNSYELLGTAFNLNKGSRNDNLFRRAQILARAGWDVKNIRLVLKNINKFLYASSVSEIEIESVLKTIKTNKNISSKDSDWSFFFNEKKKFLHDKLAEFLIKDLSLCKFEDLIYYYSDGFYKIADKSFLEQQVDNVLPFLKIGEVNECLAAIKRKIGNIRVIEKIHNYIAVKNGLLNLDSLKLEPFNKSVFIINKLNVEYKPVANEPIVLKFLNDICLNKQNYVNVLLEYIGYCLLSDCRHQKMLFLYGPKAKNGKSTFIDMVVSMFGTENTSYCSLSDIGKRFATAMLINKNLNVDADVKTNYLPEADVLKKLVTGDTFQVENKGEKPFNIKNRAKLITASNRLPPTRDKTEGFYRRLLMVKFDAVFNNETLDKQILQKLTTPDALSTLLNLAIKHLKILEENKDFTSLKESEELVQLYTDRNNNVRLFIANEIKFKHKNCFHEKSSMIIYSDYKNYCEQTKHKAFNFENFLEEFLNYFNSNKEIVKTGLIKNVETGKYEELFLFTNLIK